MRELYERLAGEVGKVVVGQDDVVRGVVTGLAVGGFGRPGRYELLVSLGRLGVVDARPSTLQLTDDATTFAAKRVFGIGDKMLLERRARELADAVEVPIEALDLGLFNWAAPERGRSRMGSRAEVSGLALTAERMAGRRHRIASVIVTRIAVPHEGGTARASERTTVEHEREGVS